MSNQSSPNQLLEAMPFVRSLGIVLDEASPTIARGHLDWAPNLTTVGNAMHGGAIMSLADAVGMVCGYLHVPPGATWGTVDSKTSFFRQLREGTLHATARPIHVGRSVMVIQTDLTDDDDHPIGTVTQTQVVVHK